MSPIAGQTARPNGLNFLWTLRGSRGGVLGKKSIFFVFKKIFNFFFFGQRRAHQLVLNK